MAVVLDVGEDLGLKDEADQSGATVNNTSQAGYSLAGIGDLTELRLITNDYRWVTGDADFIKESVNQVRRRLVSDDNSYATITKLISRIEDEFVNITTRPFEEGYSKNNLVFSSTSDQNLWRNTFEFSGARPIWAQVWGDAVSLLKTDLDDVLQALKDFQNLTAAVDEEDISSFTSDDNNQEDVTVTFDPPPSLVAQDRTATSLDGPTAGDLLTGQNFTATSTDQNAFPQKVEVHSAFYGLAQLWTEQIKGLTTLWTKGLHI